MSANRPASNPPFGLGPWHVDPGRLSIETGAEEQENRAETRVTPRAMAVLVRLAEARGEVVGKLDLLDSVWPGAEVTEGALSQTIAELRRAFGDDATNPQVIETIRRVGFRLIPAVKPIAPVDAAATPPARSRRRWWPVAAAAIVVVAVAVALLESPGQQAPQRLAVVPFEDLSPAGGYDYFARGMADEIALQLAASPQLRLVSQNAFERLARRGVTPTEAARQLDVDLLLTGSVQRRDDNVKLVAELVDARNGEQLWITRLERQMGDVFRMQDETARAIARVVLQADPLPTRPGAAVDLTAYDLFLRARDLQDRLEDAANDRALELLDEATAMDPAFAPAHAASAVSWAVKGFIFQEGETALAKALETADAALALNDQLADAYYARAVALMGLGRFDDARRAGSRILGFAPSHVDGAFIAGALADARGDIAEAVRHFTLMLQLDPTMPRTVALARLYLLLGEEELALATGRRGDRLTYGYPTLYLAHLLTLMSRADEAEALCGESLALNLPRARNLCGFGALVAGRDVAAAALIESDWTQDPRARWGPFTFAPSATHLAVVRQRQGRHNEAAALLVESRAITQRELDRGNDHWALPYNLACVAALEGEPSAALSWLDESYRNGFRDHRLLAVDPALDGIRKQAEFGNFERRVRENLVAHAAALRPLGARPSDPAPFAEPKPR